MAHSKRSSYGTADEYWEAVAAALHRKAGPYDDIPKLIAQLRGLEVKTHDELIRALPDLLPEQQIAAINLFRVLKIKRAGPALIRSFLSDNPNVHGAAQYALTSLESRRSYKPLIEIVTKYPDAALQEQACHTLAFTFDGTLWEPMLAIFETQSLPFGVRAQAAEGLSNFLGYTDRRKRPYKTAVKPLIQALRDESPEVRFWACFALGQMCAKEALPELQRLAKEDEAMCPGWWPVKDEASDAVNNILGKPVPDRFPIQA